MPMAVAKEEALAILGDARLGVLLNCLEQAWQVYDTTFRPEIPLASPTGIANCLHELA